MKTTCLINNYNYAQFLSAAIESVLNQSVKFDEIVIVDDGSTDKSCEFLKQKESEHPSIKLVLKEKNEGQLSCFNAGFLASTGDIIFFLDADDSYKPNYLENALAFYKKNNQCDFLYCGYEKFGSAKGIVNTFDEDRNLSRSVLLTLFSQKWIGDKTSTLSMTQRTLSQFLPITPVTFWRVRADACLVFGSSLVGAKKFYMHGAYINYRLHSSNNYHGKQRNASVKRNTAYYDYRLGRASLFSHIESQMNYDKRTLSKLAHLEFLSIGMPYLEDLKLYINLVLGLNIFFVHKVKMILVMLKHYVSRRHMS